MNKEALSQLGSFTGTENYYRHGFLPLVYTDGVKHLIENADAHWLLDIIGSYQMGTVKRDPSLQDMQFWHLRPLPKPEPVQPFTMGAVLKANGKMPQRPNPPTRGGILFNAVHPEAVAQVICERDTGDAAIVQDIPYTDFPFDAVQDATIWVAPTSLDGVKTVMVAYLPSEH